MARGAGLKQLRREWPQGQFILQSERDGPISAAGFRVMLARTGKAAGFAWLVHPHQLRHATGYALANKSVDTRTLQHYLGHRSIAHTVRYTELAADRFAGLWQDCWSRSLDPSRSGLDRPDDLARGSRLREWSQKR